jgi:hypothetical protein
MTDVLKDKHIMCSCMILLYVLEKDGMD